MLKNKNYLKNEKFNRWLIRWLLSIGWLFHYPCNSQNPLSPRGQGWSESCRPYEHCVTNRARYQIQQPFRQWWMRHRQRRKTTRRNKKIWVLPPRQVLDDDRLRRWLLIYTILFPPTGRDLERKEKKKKTTKNKLLEKNILFQNWFYNEFFF